MLRLKNIRKSYTTAGFTQNALDGVSIAFRDNEFAAILGPSGSGKTTMLNIIGGLDRYDSGDLEIDKISTNDYKARDWDTYRNNRIGFVFQSYNLIPHQSVLSNVELALTLSGVSRRERRKRAIDALTEVGLKDHIRKKPGQLSGGQMQRVAIARAIVNDPEILLADEPTGALDSKTSEQVMELLKKIAKDRLVIMVTHNGELAEEYATRIVHLTDGKVKSDTHPFDPEIEAAPIGREPRKARMSFITALMLSFSNLMTKKGRTLTTAFAGSIGIIGIATILALSNGINEYIRNIEEETLSMYPLAIQSQGFDLSVFFGGGDENGNPHAQTPRAERPPDSVREMRVMETLFATQNNNDLEALKAYFVENEETMFRYASAIHYTFDITPQIFIADTSDGVDQINPDSIFTAMMGGADMGPQGGNMFMPGMNVFNELPNEPALYEDQYDMLAGRWPENYDEAVLVLGFGRRITDFALFTMGIRDRSEMRAMFDSLMTGEDMEFEVSEGSGDFSFDTFMDLSFKIVQQSDWFQYDDIFNVWVDRSGDDEFMTDLVNDGLELRIVGIVQPSQDATTNVLSIGVNYTPQLIGHLMEQSASRGIVREQLANPDVNVLTGNTFLYEEENPENQFDFSRIISVDEDVFRGAMDFEDMFSSLDFDDMDFGSMNFDLGGMDFGNMDMSGLDLGGLNLDLSNMDFSNIDFGNMDLGDLDLGNLDMSAIPPPEIDIGALVQAVAAQVDIPTDVLTDLMTTIMTGFFMENPSMLIPPFDVPTIMAAFSAYLSRPEIQAMILAQLDASIDASELENQINAAVQNFLMTAMQAYMNQVMAMLQAQMQAAMQNAIQSAIQAVMTQVMGQVTHTMTTQIGAALESVMTGTMTQIASQMESAMQGIGSQIEAGISEAFEGIAEQMQESMEDFDGETLAEAFQFEMGEDEIFDLMTAIMNPSASSFEQNLSRLGYANPSVPTQILIYPRSFDAKQEIIAILDDYNARMEATGEYDRIIHYTDIVGLMMSTVTEIIDMVSYALVSFISVALVVSSIMIGVITFISVLERKKEIGILRAVGASKGNIRLVFNAETLIVGFIAGVIGVLATFGIIIVANIILYNALDIEQLVILPVGVPFVLIAISMFLTYIAGLMPASAAASKAPVEALRSE